MLRFADSRTHELVAVRPAVNSLLRVHVGGIGIRPLLVADLLRRAATVLHGWRVLVTSVETAAAAEELNIYPTEIAPENHRADVVVGAVASVAPGMQGAISLDVGAFTLDPHIDVREPLALRLAVLEARYCDPLTVDRPAMSDAEATLGRWRAAVAQWATTPGAAMPASVRRRISEPFDDDLAVSAALQALRDLEADDSVAAGAKFETFAYADRLLGLDLTSEIGR